MTVTLELKPEIEQQLAAQAQAQGLALEQYLQQSIENLVHTDTEKPRVTTEQMNAALDELAAMGADLPHLPSSAFSRGSIYSDHD